MQRLQALRAQDNSLIEEREAQLAAMEAATPPEGETRSMTDEENVAFDAAKARVLAIDEERAALGETIKELEAIEERTKATAKHAILHVAPKSETTDVINDRSASVRQIGDQLARSLEERGVEGANIDALRAVIKRNSTGNDEHMLRNAEWARGLLVRSTDEYLRAWQKYATGNMLSLTNEERAALSVGSNTNGGYLVPVHLDPTIILTNAGTANAIRPISRVATLTYQNVWNGVTSAGVTAAWRAELAEVTDNSPTFGRASIPVVGASGFVQADLEAFEDIAGLTEDVAMLLADAKDRLEAAAHATGSGSGQPTGIFTALNANTNVQITSTTAAAIGLVDIQALYKAVPVRFRGRSKWLMHPDYEMAIKALGTALSASYTTNLTQAPSDVLLGHQMVESDDAPNTQTTTALDNEVVFGDFSNYVIVDKPGSTAIEFIPQLFNTTTNLPDGRRGWFMHWRTGADSVNDLAFRMLVDKTTA